MLGLIFRKAQNKIQDPAKLRQLIVELIGKEQLDVSDVRRREGRRLRGPAGAQRPGRTKSGAGQYFTPRPLIDAIVDCVRPKPGESHLRSRLRHRRLPAGRSRLRRQPRHYKLDRDQKQHLRYDALRGVELVDRRRPPLRHEPVPPRHRLPDDAKTEPCPSNRRRPAQRAQWQDHSPTWCSPTRPSARKAAITIVTDEGDQHRQAGPSPTTATISGPPPATNSSTSSSTSLA